MSMFRHMLVVLSIGVVCGLAQGTVFADTIAYWNFNGDLTDSSVNIHNGTYSSGTPTYVVDAGTTALQLSGDGKSVSIPGSSQFQFSGDGSYTIEARVKLNSGDVNAVIDCTGPSGGAGWWLRSNSGSLQSDAFDGSGEREVTGTTYITDGAWHQVAAVFNGSTDTLSLYVDYASEGSVSYTSGSLTGTIGTGSDFRIGSNWYGNQTCSGAIDYIRVSNVALSPSEFISVPEPSTILLLAVGMLGLLAYAWRKQK